MQAGMLAESLFDPEAGVNVEQLIIDYEERLDIPALESAWQEVTRLCKALRSEFTWGGNAPSQRVKETVELHAEVHDLSQLGDESAEERYETWLADDRRTGFRLDRAPLMRLSVFRLPSRDRLVWTFHHILLDGRSMPIVLNLAERAYRSKRSGVAQELEPPASYGRFLDWLDTRDADADRAFWTGYLRGITSATPPIGLRDALEPNGVEIPRSITRHLSAETSQALLDLATACDVTLGTIVQAAWGLLCARYHGEQEVVFGVTRSGRRFGEGGESTVGLLINTVPVRVRVDEQISVRQWLGALRQDTLELRKHEATSLLDIHSVSDIPRGAPLFNSLVMLEGQPLGRRLAELDPVWAGRSLELVERSSLPLVLTVQTGTELTIDLTFDASQIDPGAIQRASSQLCTLLTAMAHGADLPVAQIDWLPESQLGSLQSFNPAALLCGEGRTVHGVIAEHAAVQPEAIAVSAKDGSLTYGDLDRRANQLARHLAENGVRPGDIVGVCLDRTTELVVSLIAVLKTGAAYLPLDTFYPKSRLATLLESTAVRTVVTLGRLRTSLPPTEAPLLLLDQAQSRIANHATTPPEVTVSAADRCYVIFTSGSTGRPKGVTTSHANLMSIFQAWQEAYRLNELRAHLQMASASFDVFSGDLVRALCSGKKLVLCPHETLMRPRELYELMQHEGVDCAEFVPLVLRMLVDHLESTSQRLDFMHVLIAGSDVWYTREYARVKKLLSPSARLINSYGISETTIDSTYFEGDVSHLPEGAVVPIGRPFRNSRVYILDALQRPVPVGVHGELYIGGHGVTAGYLGDETRTRERFISDPFAPEAAALMYRTGDVGRFRADGTIELCGRSDEQVKVRGFRIELGEVQSALEKHPDVAAGIVIAEQRGPGENRLVAYFVERAGRSIDVRKLRDFIGDRLPYYMVPFSYVRLEELPRSPNGKVDRRALPKPDDAGVDLRHHYVAPRSDLERDLCRIWQDVIGISRVGVHDDFFELGGHSLLAVTMFAKVAERTGKDLPLTALFQTRTVARLAEALRVGEKAWSCIVELTSDGSDPPLFWMHTLGGGGAGGFFRYEQLARRMGLPRPSYGIRAPQEPFRRLPDMASYYIEEVRRVQPKGPYHLLGFCFGGNLAFEMAGQLDAQGEEVAFLGLIESVATVAPASPFESLSAATGFASNAYHWARGFLTWPREKQLVWLGRNWRKVLSGTLEPADQDLEAFLEDRNRTEDYRRFVSAHWEALQHHEPTPFRGVGHVFRVRGHSLSHCERDLGWSRLCEGGVELDYLPGSHAEVLDEPHLTVTAETIARRIRALGHCPVDPKAKE